MRVENINQNHCVVFTDRNKYLTSYGRTIARIGKKTMLDRTYWDYSKTTGRYRNEFLGETINDTREKIKNGEYLLTNLNR